MLTIIKPYRKFPIKMSFTKLSVTLFASYILLTSGNALPKNKNGHTLIVGGSAAQQGEIPYQLSLKYESEHHCGASIIEVQGVVLAVTAAHCTPDYVPVESFSLVAGDISLSDTTGIEQTRKVTKIVNHQNFNAFTFENDIALVFIDESFDYNDNVSPIALPDASAEPTGDFLVSGWGRLEYQGSSPDVLQQVEVPLVTNEDCTAAYAELGNEIFGTVFCAGILGVGGKDACQGDSGGPSKSIDGDYLAGIVSWGEGCAEPNYPGVYTRVAKYIDWINDNVYAYRHRR